MYLGWQAACHLELNCYQLILSSTPPVHRKYYMDHVLTATEWHTYALSTWVVGIWGDCIDCYEQIFIMWPLVRPIYARWSLLH
jgi:hypothetical protein